MVRMNYPSELTEEEEMLQRKYAKLKKKKKLLQSLKTKKQEEPTPAKQPINKRSASEAALDAKEEAKKLIKAGAIKLQSGLKEKSFKRAKSKISKDDKGVPQVGFQPFAGSQSTTEDKPESSQGPRMKNLYNSFVKGSHDEEAPKRGHTIYVHGHRINEVMLKSVFSNIGNIVNVNVEMNKDCGFITFDKTESADKAINEMDGAIVSSVRLKVSLARRQPNFDQPFQDGSAPSNSWSTIAASHSQKGSHKDKRELVSYTEEDIF